MKQHLNKSERVKSGGAIYVMKPPKKKFSKGNKSYDKVGRKLNPTTRRYE